jgi:nucleoside-diphosphate-sugar epimerase
VLFHLAGYSSGDMHENDPQRGCRVNVEGFVNNSSASANRAVRPSSTPQLLGSTAVEPSRPRKVWQSKPRQPTRPQNSPANATPGTTRTTTT